MGFSGNEGCLRSLGQAERLIREAEVDLDRGNLDSSRSALMQAWNEIAPLVRSAKNTGGVKIEVSQIAGGGHSVRVLKGDAVVQSPLRTIRLETGTGVILGDESVPGEVHKLVDPPLLVYPEPYHTFYNVTSIPLRWTPVD